MMSPEQFQSVPPKWRHRWWFFDPAHEVHDSESSRAWEVARRSIRYQELFAEGASLIRQGAKDAGDRIAHALMTGRGGDVPSALRWWASPLHQLAVNVRCDPAMRWIDLTPGQRQSTAFCLLLPTHNPPHKVTNLSMGLVAIKRDTSGALKSNGIWHSGDALGLFGFEQTPQFQSLAIEKCGIWAVVLFDTRTSGQRLQDQLEEFLDTLTDPADSTSTLAANLKKHLPKEHLPATVSGPLVSVVPSSFYSNAACLIPAHRSLQEIAAHFLNAVRPENRRRWLPQCEAHWEQMLPLTGAKPLPSLRQTKAASRKHLWLALAAFDLQCLPVQDPVVKLFCDMLMTSTPRSSSSPTAPRPYHRRRRSAYNHLHTLASDAEQFIGQVETCLGDAA